MTCLLALDTTTELCSVALDCGSDGVFEHNRLAPRLHNRYLLEMIDGVLRAAAVARTDVDFLAFGAGPGSFTGVRIGAAVAQGIALAVDALVVRVPSSAVTAESARRAGLRGDCSIRRTSRPGWHYHARCRLTDERTDCLAFDQLAPSPSAARSDAIPAHEAGDTLIDGDSYPPHARLVAHLARQRLDEAVSAANALPFYVDGDSPWKASA